MGIFMKIFVIILSPPLLLTSNLAFAEGFILLGSVATKSSQEYAEIQRAYCQKAEDITASVAEDISVGLGVSASSVRLLTSTLSNNKILCCLTIDTPKGIVKTIAIALYKSVTTGRIIADTNLIGIKKAGDTTWGGCS